MPYTFDPHSSTHITWHGTQRTSSTRMGNPTLGVCNVQAPCSVSIYETCSIDLRKTIDRAALGAQFTLATALQNIRCSLSGSSLRFASGKKIKRFSVKICLVRFSIVVPYIVSKLRVKLHVIILNCLPEHPNFVSEPKCKSRDTVRVL